MTKAEKLQYVTNILTLMNDQFGNRGQTKAWLHEEFEIAYAEYRDQVQKEHADEARK